jgi:hypothetical protein
MSRLSHVSGAIRSESGMSSALWWLKNGRASAPDAFVCRTGVSTSSNSCRSRKSRVAFTSCVRSRKRARVSSFVIRSR